MKKRIYLIPKRPCEYCWETFTPKTRSRNTKYCSGDCKKKACNERIRKKKELAIIEGESNQFLKLRFRVLRRDKFICQYCGRRVKDGIKLHIDHIIPKSRGGKYEFSNLITSCFECNEGKRDVLLEKREIDSLRNI